jgi:hypothetical protein
MENIHKERETIKKIKLRDPGWKHWVIDFLAEHKYYTKTQIDERGEQKKRNISRLQSMIEELENEEI